VTTAKIQQGSNGQVVATEGSDTVWKRLDTTWIDGFDTQVRASRLDQMAAPTSSLGMNSQRMINLATPTSGTDAATKTYVDNIRDLTASSHVCTMTGSTTSVSFNATCGFLVGHFTIMIPIKQGGLNDYFVATGVITSSLTTNGSNPIRVFVPDSDANVGSYFAVYFTRTIPGSGSTVTFTVSHSVSQGVSTTIDLDTSRQAQVFFTRGSS
jgi:hypothetical protein